MGKSKKGKKAKKKKLYRLNMRKFQKEFCERCNLCRGSSKPAFCFNVMYLDAPEAFVQECFPRLRNIKAWPAPSHDETKEFQKVFCLSSACAQSTVKCEYMGDCLTTFRNQQDPLVSAILGAVENEPHPLAVKAKKLGKKARKKERKEKARKERQNRTPYPTFITNGDEAWLARMRKILYGDNYQEPVTVEGDARPPEESSGTATQDS